MRLGFCLATIVSAICIARPGVASESLELATNSAGTLHVAARLGDAGPAEFLLDTGSAYVVLSGDTLERLERQDALVKLRTLRAVMANNQTVSAPVYRVARLELSAQCVIRDFEAVALPGARKNILGLSALRHVAPFTVHLTPTRLEINCDSASPPSGAGDALVLN